MSDNKLVKTVIDAAVLNGIVAVIGWAAKTVVKENFTSDSSSSPMNYANPQSHWPAALGLNGTLRTKKSSQQTFETGNSN